MLGELLFLVVSLTVCHNQVLVQNLGCSAVLCAEGTTCVETPVQCIRAPCPSMPRCVPISSGQSKPGRCPRAPSGLITTCEVKCESDDSCSGKQKCCASGCGRECKSPTRASNRKPGSCPMDFLPVFRMCTTKIRHTCRGDNQCRGPKKCCWRECGRRCATPNNKHGQTKQGRCPRAPISLVTTCEVKCESDGSCSGKQKCCPWGCGRECKLPARASNRKPGSCPMDLLPVFRMCTTKIRNTCRGDNQCRGPKKCCWHECGRRCVTPVKRQPGFNPRPIG